MGCEVVALVVPGGRHAPLDWNSYCVHELAHNTLLFLFFFTNNCCFSIKVYHVLLCMSRNTGQINPAGFQSLKYMYYTHVIMTIKWFLTLTLTLTMKSNFTEVCNQHSSQHCVTFVWVMASSLAVDKPSLEPTTTEFTGASTSPGCNELLDLIIHWCFTFNFYYLLISWAAV